MSDKSDKENTTADSKRSPLVADDDGNGVYTAVIALSSVAGHDRNYNHHPVEQVAGLSASVEEFGYVRRIVVQEKPEGGYTAVAGHGMVESLTVKGYENVEAAVIPADWPAHKVLAYLVADNEQAKAAVVQGDLLFDILRDVAIDGGADTLEATGISQEDVDAILAGIGAYGDGDGDGGGDPQDAEPEISRADELREEWGVETGQVWILPSRVEGN